MAPIRIPKALKGLEIYRQDPRYWQKVLRLNDADFCQYAQNVYRIIRAKWSGRDKLNRFDKRDIKLVSAHLRSTIDRMSTYWSTTSGELDEMLIVTVAFAFFLNDLDKYKEVAPKLSKSLNPLHLRGQENALNVANQEPSSLATDAQPNGAIQNTRQKIKASVIYVLASYSDQREATANTLEQTAKRIKLAENSWAESDLEAQNTITDQTAEHTVKHPDSTSTSSYSVLTQIENAKKRKRNSEE